MIGVVEASIEIDGNVSGLAALPLVASLGNGAAFLGINIILQSQRIPFLHSNLIQREIHLVV